ncbi:hypothetical protein MUK42_29789 [Musa troglodytarum]|uniref:Uncharacterized protein n=1 Tax=Musa troglodytarum TaxID=320322 RepID=A0A9E7FFD1_9LILI|nr:hypothetical protein MUK42_29789 [Musa troglodytarum]
MTCDGITSRKFLQLAYSCVAGTKSGSMAGGGAGGRTLEQTSTWAVATVCFALVIISITIERGIHLIAKWLEKHRKRALQEALEKVKSGKLRCSTRSSMSSADNFCPNLETVLSACRRTDAAGLRILAPDSGAERHL